MAWHKIGNSYYSDEEMRSSGTDLYHILVDIGLPGLLTYLGVKALSTFMEHYNFFVVHTTTAKLIYIVAGLFIFCIGYSLRHFVIAMTFLAFVGVFLLAIFADFFHWLIA